jgi:hypothetical protein
MLWKRETIDAIQLICVEGETEDEKINNNKNLSCCEVFAAANCTIWPGRIHSLSPTRGICFFFSSLSFVGR